MKDEEMAEEYKEKHICNTCADIQDCGNYCPFSQCAVQGFLAGLKAGRPQWHKIESKVSPKREISKKYMPKSEEKVLLKYHFYDDNEIHISDGYYDAYDFQFHIANNPKFRIVCVIAWCELPTFDKE